VLDLIVSSGFPRPAVNAPIHLEDATYEVDFLFAAERVVVEADGERFHGTSQARDLDATRQAALEAAGYRVVRLTWQQVKRGRAQTVSRLRRALEAPPRAP